MEKKVREPKKMKKLELHKETLRQLEGAELKLVGGGVGWPTQNSCIAGTQACCHQT